MCVSWFSQKKLKKHAVFIRFGKRVALGWLARPAGWNTRVDLQKASITFVFHGFTTKTFKNLMFPDVLGSGWLQAGWLGRLAGIPVLNSKKQVLHRFFMVLPQKPPKPNVFIRFRKPQNAGFHNIAPLSVRLQFWLLNVNFTRCF